MKNFTIKKYFSGLTKNTFLLAASSLFADISTEMLYPIVPIYLTQTLKASGSIIGIIEGVAQATQNVVQGFSGWLSDKLQKRKPIALIGYTLAAISKPLIGFAGSWQVVLEARFLDRFGTGIRSAPRDALVAASADDKNRGKAFGLEGFGDNLGAFLGPLLAVLLLFFFAFNIRSIFYFAFIPAVLAAVMILFVKEKTTLKNTHKKINIRISQFPANYWKYIGVTVLFGLGNSSNAFLILQTKSLGVSLMGTILIYSVFNLIAALTSYPSGSLSDTFGRKKILLLCFLVFFITYLGFSISANVFIVAGLFILYGVYQGVFRSVGKAFASDFVPQTLRGSSIGWYSTAVGLSGLIASIVAGELWDKVGHPAVFLYGAIFAAAGSIALLFFIRQPENNLT
jgi:MFS family permease